MKFRPATLLIVVLYALLSCNDESEDPLTYPSTFVKTQVTFNGSYRIFSSNGVIQDQKIINRHIEEDTAMFKNRADDLMYPGRLDTIFFESPTNATISLNYKDVACDVEKHSAFEYQFMLRDTVSGTTVMNELSHHVRYYLSEVKPEIISETLMSSVRGYYQFKYRIRQPLILDYNGNNEIIVPVVIYQWSYYFTATNLGSYVDLTFNKLNERFYEDLSESDTVSVIQANIHFKRN